jgi:hypothetical protein
MASNAFHIGFWLTNLFIPGEPKTFTVSTSRGTWEFHQHPAYRTTKTAVLTKGMTGYTYAAETSGPTGNSRSASLDAAFDELIPLCLAASYLTGMSVAPVQSTPMSQIQVMTMGHYFPRPRAMGQGFPATTTEQAFIALTEKFLAGWLAVGATEKPRLLIHHWLDALAYWSLEDLVLSTGTILEIIADTAGSLGSSSSAPLTTFKQRIAYAATRFNLAPLPSDFRKMRNDLVHEGTLSGTKFPGKNVQDCTVVAGHTLNWIDEYIFAAMSLGPVQQSRFDHGFPGINSFSL